MLEQQRGTAEAIAAYRKALTDSLYVTSETAWFNHGRALRRQGQLREAVNAHTEAARLAPSSLPPGMAQLELGRTYHQLGEEEKAREALNQAAEVPEGGEYAAAADKLLQELEP